MKSTNTLELANNPNDWLQKRIRKDKPNLCDPTSEQKRCVLLKRQGNSRVVVDNPILSDRNVCERMMITFADESYKVCNPSNWFDASGIDGLQN